MGFQEFWGDTQMHRQQGDVICLLVFFLNSKETRLKKFFGLPEREPLFHYFPACSVITVSTEPTQLIHNIKWEVEVLKFLKA
jgi:hypothetical protein